MFIATFSRYLSRHLLALGLLSGGIALAATPRTASAEAAPTRIAVVNLQKVFNEMQETKALNNRIAEEQKKITAEGDARQAALQKMRVDRDSNFKPGTEQWFAENKKLIEASYQFETWVKTQRALMDDSFKQQIRQLFDKVQAAAGDVAKREGYDIVINDTSERPEALDQADLRTLKALLVQRTIVFAGDKSDITTAVIIQLDAKYKAQAQGK